jgi:hypothetical protein
VPRIVDSLRRRLGGPGRVIRAAHAAAESDDPDESAALRLSSVVASARRDARAALKYFASRRGDFERDRAYRLLEAAVKGESVVPIRQECRAVFVEEEKLGRMPLADAFGVLAELKPELRKLADDAAASASSQVTPVQAIQDSEERRRLSATLLDDVDHGRGLSGSGLARSIVAQYLQILEGSDDSDPSRPYFALARKRVVLTSRFDSR